MVRLDRSFLIWWASLFLSLHVVQGQVSVSSSAAASVKYPPLGSSGYPQAYISSLSSAKADPHIPVIINQPMTVNGNAAGTGEVSPSPPEPQQLFPIPPIPPVPSPLQPLLKSPIEKLPKINWSYKPSQGAYGPGNWAKLAPQCAGQNQSPINIFTSMAKPKPLNHPLSISMNEGIGGGEAAIVHGRLINNGKALGFNLNAEAYPVKLSGGVLEGTSYTMRQFHLHYGCEGQKGSEHTLDGVRYDGELHLVFTNDKYIDSKTAMQQHDGLAILAFFITIRPQADPNIAIERISRQAINVMYPQQQIIFPDGISLTNLIPAMKEGLNNLRRYVYKGSLPTPPCFESVTWIVFYRPIGVLPGIFDSLRKIRGDNGQLLCGNVRPLQPQNGREVFFFTPAAPSLPVPTGMSTGPRPTSKPPTRRTTRPPSTTRLRTSRTPTRTPLPSET